MPEPDLFDKLAEIDVPPPPADLDGEVHRRVNRFLLAMHLADLGLRGMAYALAHFARGVTHLLVQTAKGHSWPPRDKHNP